MKWIIFLFCITPFLIIDISAEPSLDNSNYSVEKFVDGLVFPTTMAFVDEGIMVLEKNSGKVKFIQNGLIQESSLLDFNVDGLPSAETGLLGILVDKNLVYIYVSETEKDGGKQIANRIYEYFWDGSSLTNQKLIHEFPSSPRYSHVGGIMVKNMDDEIFVIIGDMASSNDGLDGPTQNSKTNTLRDTGIILKIDKENHDIENSKNKINNYFAIGIRNSFGMTVDPFTENLWDTENGPWNFDEINLIEPKFNSGWEKIMGPATDLQISSLPKFGNFQYSDPEFTWQKTIAPTSLVFFNSEHFLENNSNLLVADCINGNLYEFKLDTQRTGFIFEDKGLQDKILNNMDSMREIIYGTGFGCITDLKFGPDGYLYIVSLTDGIIYRIIPTNEEIKNDDKIKPFVNLSNKDFKFQDLTNSDLRFANLTNSDLLSVELKKANLQNVNLSNANLDHANLENANLENANLENANLLGSYFGFSNIENANLENAKIKSSNFTFSKISFSNLKNVDFRASDLSYANFSYANLTNANLAHSDLSYANFSGADLRGLYYYNTDVTGTIINNETTIDGCFGQDLWNKILSKIFRWSDENENIITHFIKLTIPNLCMR